MSEVENKLPVMDSLKRLRITGYDKMRVASEPSEGFTPGILIEIRNEQFYWDVKPPQLIFAEYPRRVVACWNACAGIATRDLEDGKVAEIRAELADLRHFTTLQAAASARAIALWQAAHPDRSDIWPDQAALLVWLLEQLDGMRAERDGFRAQLARAAKPGRADGAEPGEYSRTGGDNEC